MLPPSSEWTHCAHFSSSEKDITCIQCFYSRRLISDSAPKVFYEKTGYVDNTPLSTYKFQTSTVKKCSAKHNLLYLYSQSRPSENPYQLGNRSCANLAEGPFKGNSLSCYANFFLYDLIIIDLFGGPRSKVIPWVRLGFLHEGKMACLLSNILGMRT